MTGAESPIVAHLATVAQPQCDRLTALRAVPRELLPGAVESIRWPMPCVEVGGIPAWCTVASTRTLQFPVDHAVPKALVRRLVRARLRESADRSASTRRR